MPDTVRPRADLVALFPDNNRGLISAQDVRDLIASISTTIEANALYSPLIHTHTDLELNTLGLSFYNQTYATSNANPANYFSYRVDATTGYTYFKLPTIGDGHKRTFIITKIDATANYVVINPSSVSPIVTLDGLSSQIYLTSQWESIIVTGVGSATSTAYSTIFKSKMTNAYVPITGGTISGSLTFSPSASYSISGLYQLQATYLTGNGAGITALNASNINAGTLPASVFTDTTHGTRGNGTAVAPFHAVATQTVPGFMSAQDKIALDNGVGNTANKIDKVAGAVPNHLAAFSLDGTGNLYDAGYPISALALAAGTNSNTFQININSFGPILKQVSGALQIRNSGDTDFADLYAANFYGSGTNLTNLNANNIGSGTIPAGHINDISHGNRGGGSLHSLATESTPGFMSAEDKTILDQIVTNGLPNNGGGGISNVTITNPSDKDVLIFNQGTSVFINRHLTQSDVTPNFVASSFSVTTNPIVEAGSTLSGLTWAASYLNTAASAVVTDDGGGAQSTASAYPYNTGNLTSSYSKITHASSVTWTLTATPVTGTGNVQILTYKTTWNVKRFWGVGATGGSTGTFVQGLPSSDLIDARKISFVATSGLGQKIYYACKASFGTPMFYMGGLNGGFSLIANNIVITNTYGVADTYQLWATNQENLGTVEVDVDTDNEVGGPYSVINNTHIQNTDIGTTASSFQIDMTQGGPRIKNAASVMQVRDAADATLAPLAVLTVTGGNSTDNAQLTGLGVDRVGVSTDLPLIIRPKNAGALQTASSGNVRGSYAVDLQRSKTMNVQVATGNYSVLAGGSNNQANGLNGVVGGGRGNVQAGEGGFIAGGIEGRQDFYGGSAHASGCFTVIGDAQKIDVVSRGISTSASTLELFLDNSSTRLVVPSNTTWQFVTRIVARRTDGTTDCAGFIFSGIVSRDDAASTVSFFDPVEKTVFNNSTGLWDASVYVDTSSGSLSFSTLGEANKTIRWVAFTQIVQVSNG